MFHLLKLVHYSRHIQLIDNIKMAAEIFEKLTSLMSSVSVKAEEEEEEEDEEVISKKNTLKSNS